MSSWYFKTKRNILYFWDWKEDDEYDNKSLNTPLKAERDYKCVSVFLF